MKKFLNNLFARILHGLFWFVISGCLSLFAGAYFLIQGNYAMAYCSHYAAIFFAIHYAGIIVYKRQKESIKMQKLIWHELYTFRKQEEPLP